MARYIPLLLIFVFTISIPPHIEAQHPDFTHNIWPSSHFEFDSDQDVTPYESYLRLDAQNKASNRIKNRSDFTHKLDSVLYWNQEGSFEVNNGKNEYLFQYGDELTDVKVFFFEKENDVFSSFPTSFTVTDYTKRNLIKKHTFTNNPVSKDTFDHTTAFTNREYSYNENEKLILYEDQNQFAIINDRITNRKVYRYDSLGLPKYISHYFWYPNDDTITHVREMIYKHNDQNQLESIVNRILSFERGWEYDDSTSLSYDTIGNLYLEQEYNWNWQTGFFQPFTETYFTDYIDGKLTSKTLYRVYDKENEEFFIKNVFDYGYHDYGSLELEEFFITSNDNFKELSQTWSYKHNEQISSDETMIPRYMNYEESREHNEVYVLDEYESYSGLGSYSYLILESRQQYFYSEIDGVSTNDPIKANSNNLKVSPNPVIDNLLFEVLDYSGNLDIIVYDINGHATLKKEMVNKGDVDVSFLSSGVYFYTVRAGDKLLSGRFLKN